MDQASPQFDDAEPSTSCVGGQHDVMYIDGGGTGSFDATYTFGRYAACLDT